LPPSVYLAAPPTDVRWALQAERRLERSRDAGTIVAEGSMTALEYAEFSTWALRESRVAMVRLADGALMEVGICLGLRRPLVVWVEQKFDEWEQLILTVAAALGSNVDVVATLEDGVREIERWLPGGPA
jgi:hypothetical protein